MKGKATPREPLKPGKCCRGNACHCKLSCNCGCMHCVCSGGFRKWLR